MAIKPYMVQGKRFYEVRVKMRDSQGRQVCRRRAGINSIRKAEQVEFELKSEIMGVAKNAPIFTWEVWHEECLKRMRLELKVGTVINYDGALKKWLIEIPPIIYKTESARILPELKL